MLYPMAAIVLLTLIIALFTISVRFASVRQGDVKARYFKLMQGQEVPELVAKTSRSFNNQFEVPILFYTVATLYIALDLESTLALTLAWGFVGLRVVHAFIHLTYNHVLHRLLAFVGAFACVIGLWINLLLQYQA